MKTLLLFAALSTPFAALGEVGLCPDGAFHELPCDRKKVSPPPAPTPPPRKTSAYDMNCNHLIDDRGMYAECQRKLNLLRAEEDVQRKRQNAEDRRALQRTFETQLWGRPVSK